MVSTMQHWRILCIVVCFFLLTTDQIAHGKRIPSFAGPFKIILTRFVNNIADDEVGDRKIWLRGYTQTYRPGHPQFFQGKENNSVPLTDDYRLTIRVDKRSNNQWKKNAFIMKFPNGCSDLIKYGPAIFKLAFPGPMKCPLAPAERIIANKTVNLGMEQIPVFPYGVWRVTFTWSDKAEKIIGAFACEAETIPKLN